MIIACPTCGLQLDVRTFAQGTQIMCRCQTVLQVPAHVVAALRCPTCGGTADASAQRCQFCHSRIDRQVCQRCSATLRDEARFCDQCGAPRDPAATTPTRASDSTCPRCKVPLFHQQCSGLAIEACAECLGIWTSHEAMAQLVIAAPRHIQPVVAGTPSRAAPDAARDRAQPAAYIPCPSCGQLMTPKNYGGYGGVAIDYCSLHGAWFDANELYLALEHIARSGGFERLDHKGSTRAAPAALPGPSAPEAAALRQRIQAQTLENLERAREESLGALIGDAVIDAVGALRAQLKRLKKGSSPR